jgi:cell division protease FtsH
MGKTRQSAAAGEAPREVLPEKGERVGEQTRGGGEGETRRGGDGDNGTLRWSDRGAREPLDGGWYLILVSNRFWGGSIMGKRRKRAPALLKRLQQHFQRNPAELPVIEQKFEPYERPNLHLAIEELLQEPGRDPELLGIVVAEEYHSLTLSKLSRKSSARSFDEGPVEYVDVALAGGQQLACLKRGLYLFRHENQPIAMLVAEERFHETLSVEVMGVDRASAEEFLRRLTRRTRHGKAFRGHVLSVEQDCHRRLSVRFHALPAVRRDEIILPEAVLRRIERQALGFSRHAEKLRAAGRHLKRGVLLHGSPGTGKTLSAMYLAAQSPGRTVLLITGGEIGSIEVACRLARLLEPATIILEDVDLIGAERSGQSLHANALLFELLNQMDGLAEDCDVLFVLTTNRPDILEPALASRPGRIDLAIEVPLPDADCRRRLLELYGRGLQLKLTDMERLVERTATASGAFIRELLRKAAIFAAEENGGSPLIVHDRHIEEALTELVVAGGTLTQSLLGAQAHAKR